MPELSQDEEVAVSAAADFLNMSRDTDLDDPYKKSVIITCGANAWFITAKLLIEKSTYFSARILQQNLDSFEVPGPEIAVGFIIGYLETGEIDFARASREPTLDTIFEMFRIASYLEAPVCREQLERFILSRLKQRYLNLGAEDRAYILGNAYRCTNQTDRIIRNAAIRAVISDLVTDIEDAKDNHDNNRLCHYSRICYIQFLDLLGMISAVGFSDSASYFLRTAVVVSIPFLQQRQSSRRVVQHTQQVWTSIIEAEIAIRRDEYLESPGGDRFKTEGELLLEVCAEHIQIFTNGEPFEESEDEDVTHSVELKARK